jgi:hypothetical protein
MTWPDWGNLPSWFSGLSFTAAAIVIVRDRRHRQRKQVDDIGVWGNFHGDDGMKELLPDSLAMVILPKISVRNASNLPARVVSIRYVVHYRWAESIDGEMLGGTYTGGPYKARGQVGDRTAPPAETIVLWGDPLTAENRPDENAVIGEGIRDSWLEITGITVIDNAHRKWELAPKQDRGPMRIPDALVPLADAGRSMREVLVEMGRAVGQIFPFVFEPFRFRRKKDDEG